MIGFQKPEPASVDRVGEKRRMESAMAKSRAFVWERDQRKCRYCERVVIRNPDPFKRGEVHHIVPRSRLKKTEYAATDNLVLLCHEHHRDAQAYRLFISGHANGVLIFRREGAASEKRDARG